jgi:hypothetical protein
MIGIVDENIRGVNDGINCLIICKVFEECVELSVRATLLT